MIYDLTLTITPDLVVWPGSNPVEMEHVAHLDRGDDSTNTFLRLGAHTGTHLDAPAHFVPGGAGVEQLDLNVLVGPAVVIDVPDGVDILTAEALDRLPIPAGAQRVLFRTRNSAIWAENTTTFVEDYVALERTGAQWIVDRGVKLVGIDYLSIAAWRDLIVTHQILLGAGVIAVEGLNLAAVSAGTYQFVCLPVKLGGSDGAPVRAILMDV